MTATARNESDSTPFLSDTPMDVLRIAQTLHAPSEEPQRVLGSCTTARKEASESRFGYIAQFSPWFPKLDPSHPQAQTWRTRRSNRATALAIHQLTTASVLVVNFVWMTWAWAKFGSVNNVGTMYQGNCKQTKQLNTWIHLGINVLSTILLGSSNFCMQLLVSPTRRELDRTHDKGDSLDLGVPSFKNLGKIARSRLITWLLLGFSSGVLHLLWNSAVFESLPLDSYRVAIVTNDYMSNNATWNLTDKGLSQLRLSGRRFERLERLECIKRYYDPLSVGKDLVVVTDASSNEATFNDGSSLLNAFQPQQQSSTWDMSSWWMCSTIKYKLNLSASHCSLDLMKRYADKWIVLDGQVRSSRWEASVSYCLSAGPSAANNRCELNFSTTIMILVCISNLAKFLCICYTAYCHKTPTVVTIGDAITSYLQLPDDNTRGECLITRRIVDTKSRTGKAIIWHVPAKTYWYQAAPLRRWIITMTLAVAMLAVAAALLGASIGSLKHAQHATDLKSLWDQELGTVSGDSLSGLSGLYSFVSAVLFANLFQLVVSFLYLMYNSLLTCLLVAVEFSGFAVKRKTLRVSSPQGIQRSSYFLSLPYRYGLPLTTASGILHWLISQSVFLVQTHSFDIDEKRTYHTDGSRVGYSSIGIIYATSLGAVMLIALAMIGFRRLPSGPAAMPLASTNSLAISATCHAPPQDTDASMLPVQWGVTEWDGKVGHCCFTTARDVAPPIPGQKYR